MYFTFTQKMKNLLQDNIPYHDLAPRPAITRLRPFSPLDGDRGHFLVTTTADPVFSDDNWSTIGAGSSTTTSTGSSAKTGSATMTDADSTIFTSSDSTTTTSAGAHFVFHKCQRLILWTSSRTVSSSYIHSKGVL